MLVSGNGSEVGPSPVSLTLPGFAFRIVLASGSCELCRWSLAVTDRVAESKVCQEGCQIPELVGLQPVLDQGDPDEIGTLEEESVDGTLEWEA